ncbi:MAG: hypothetical protein RPR98_08575 [Bermanella sp.]
MLAKFKSHPSCKALIYLVCLVCFACLNGCGEPSKQTIVTLHFKSPAALEGVILESLKEEVSVEIAGQQIIFFAAKDQLQDTLALLRLLDKGPVLYRLSFKAVNKHRYSTSALPPTLTLAEGEYSSVRHASRYKIERRNEEQSLLLIENQTKDNLQRQFILMSHSEWLEVQPATLNSSISIKIDLLEEPSR